MLSLKVLSVEKVETPKIVYSYLQPVDKPDTFVWDNKGPWSQCSHDCQGMLYMSSFVTISRTSGGYSSQC